MPGFLDEGHKVKITIMFRGREMSHPELGKRILDRVAEQVAAAGRVESAAKLDGRNMMMVLAPDKRAQAQQPRPKPSTPAQHATRSQQHRSGSPQAASTPEAGRHNPQAQHRATGSRSANPKSQRRPERCPR